MLCFCIWQELPVSLCVVVASFVGEVSNYARIGINAVKLPCVLHVGVVSYARQCVWHLGCRCVHHLSVFALLLQFEFLLSQKPGHPRIGILLLQLPFRCQLLAELVLVQQSGILPSCLTILSCPGLLE